MKRMRQWSFAVGLIVATLLLAMLAIQPVFSAFTKPASTMQWSSIELLEDGGDLDTWMTEVESYLNGAVAMPGQRVTVEVVDGNDTLKLAQSGSTIIYRTPGTTTLPEATASSVGVYYTLVDPNATGAADLIIDPEGDGTINGDTAGNYVTNETDADGCSCFIVCTAADTWYAVFTPSAWTEE